MIQKAKSMEIDELQDVLKIISTDEDRSISGPAFMKLDSLYAELPNIEQLLPLLLEAFRDPKAGWAVTLTLGRLGDKSFDFLMEALEDEDATIRSRACVALSRNKSPRRNLAIPALLKAIADQDIGVRESALTALTHYSPDPAITSVLVNALIENKIKSLTWDIVARYLASVGIRDSRLLPPTLAALRSADPFIRPMALVLLAVLGEKQVVDELIELINNDAEDAATKDTTVSVIASLLKEEAQAFLIEQLSHPDVNVRYAAADMLGYYGNKDSLPILTEVAETDLASPTFAHTSPVSVQSAALKSIEAIKAREQAKENQ